MLGSAYQVSVRGRKSGTQSESLCALKISTATALGLLSGAMVGLVGIGKVDAFSPGMATEISQHSLWIIALSMLAPLVDYLAGMRATLLGYVTRHPLHHWAGFFTGLAVGLGFLLLFSPRLF